MILRCPCYQMNGTLWHEDDTPSGLEIAYHVSRWGFDANRLCCLTPEIKAAINRYTETIQDLLLAGF